MKLTSKGRYAVMALVDLAKFNNINPVSLRDISLRQGISLDYLELIFAKLRKKEIVQSVQCKKESKKGRNGKPVKCLTHDLWDELENHINNFFDKKSLDDLVKDNEEKRV